MSRWPDAKGFSNVPDKPPSPLDPHTPCMSHACGCRRLVVGICSIQHTTSQPICICPGIFSSNFVSPGGDLDNRGFLLPPRDAFCSFAPRLQSLIRLRLQSLSAASFSPQVLAHVCGPHASCLRSKPRTPLNVGNLLAFQSQGTPSVRENASSQPIELFLNLGRSSKKNCLRHAKNHRPILHLAVPVCVGLLSAKQSLLPT